jgi:hypothetical protein
VQLVTGDGTVTVLSLWSEDVTEKLEVCCFAARAAATLSTSDEYDNFRLADFRIDEVFVLRRAEWLEPPELPGEGIGGNAKQQRIGVLSDAPPWTTHALVDAGVLLVDKRGSRLLFQADAFPLVIQCHYSLSSAVLPQGEARAIE